MTVKRSFIYDPSLVLYLPLHELDGASFMSRDTYGHLGSVTGAGWRIGGRYFDGTDDEITIPHATSLDFTTALTIQFWVNPDNQNDRSIITKFENVAGKKQYLLQLDTLKCRLLLRNAADTGYLSTTASNSQMDALVWQNWAVTWDGSNIRYYKNGIADGTPSASGSVISTTTPIDIGRYIGGASYFAGYIGEILMYNRAFSSVEIQHNYLATKWRYR